MILKEEGVGPLRVRARKTIAICVLLSTVLVLAACGSNPKKQKGGGDEFYDGREKTLYKTGNEAKTTEEAFQRGQNALASGDSDRALYEFVQAYVLDNENADALYQIGVIHAGRNNILKAIVAFSKVLKIKQDKITKEKDEAKKDDPSNKDILDAQEWLGLLEMRQRNYPMARGFLENVVKEDEKRWRAYNALAVIADLQKKYDSAHYYYLKALDANPGSPALLNNLGYSQYLAGDWNRAIVTISMALRVAPDYQKAWHNLALIYVRQKRYDEALRALGQIMDRPHAYATIGDLSLLERDYARAEEYLLKAIKASPAYFKEAFESLARVREYRSKTAQGGTLPGAEPGWVGAEHPLGEAGLPAGPGVEPGQWSGELGGSSLPAQVFPIVPPESMTGTPIEPVKPSAPAESNVSLPAGTVSYPNSMAPPANGATTGPLVEPFSPDSAPLPSAPLADPGPATVRVPAQQSVEPEPQATPPLEENASLPPAPATGPNATDTPALPKAEEGATAGQPKAAAREPEAAGAAPAEQSQMQEILMEPGEANNTNATDAMDKPATEIIVPTEPSPTQQTAPAAGQVTTDVTPGQTTSKAIDAVTESPQPDLGRENDAATDAPNESPTSGAPVQPDSSSDVRVKIRLPQPELQQPATAPAPDSN